MGESTTPLLQSKSPEELSIAQVMFVDQRNNNLLVRHRLPNYSVLHYFWINITEVHPLQTPFEFSSLQQVLKSIEECFQGLICEYAKQVLTRLSEIVETDALKLIKENILDAFVNDPVEGWMQPHSTLTIQPLI